MISMSIGKISDELYESGMDWEGYLDRAEHSRATQIKRFVQAADEYSLEVQQIPDGLRALIVTLPDCADGAWAVPRLVSLLATRCSLPVRIFHRDDHPELMELLLTRGKRSIPKMALIDSRGIIVAKWGPRPAPIQAYVEESVGKIDTIKWKEKLFEYYRGEESKVHFYQEMDELLKGLQ